MLNFSIALFCSFLFGLTASAPSANAIETGEKAPPFSAKSGEDNSLTLEIIREKNLVILYESPDAEDENEALQDQLSALYDESDRFEETTIVVPIVDCTSASWPLIPFWKRDIRKRSEEEDLTIYCDWDGSILRDYGMTRDHSNVVLIDRNGTVRYVHRGKAPQERIDELKELLRTLAGATEKTD